MGFGRLLLVLLLSHLLLGYLPQRTNAFVFPIFSFLHQKDHRQAKLLSQLLHLRATLNHEEESSSWDLKEDWALMDNVPRFTVGDAHHARTFWMQLGTAIPCLLRFSESDLMERYSILLQVENRTTTAAYPAPSLLQDWYIRGRSQMQGCLEDGRTIWFDVQAIGRLGDDPIGSNPNIKEEAESFAGGFVEAAGGRVYELGMPLQNPNVVSGIFETKEEEIRILDLLDKNKKPIAMTIASAALSVALFSVAAGYGAGIAVRNELAPTISTRYNEEVQILHENRNSVEARVLHEQRSLSSLQDRLQEDLTELQQLRTEESKAGDPAKVAPMLGRGPSLTEKRARMESRVLGEERMLDSISKQLSVDGARLQDLTQREKLLP